MNGQNNRKSVKKRTCKGKKQNTESQPVTIAYNNVQRLGIAKQIEVSNLLGKEKFSVFAVVETFLTKETPICNVNQDYQWIGKNRISSQKQAGGGVGFFVRKEHEVLDDNVLQSGDDALERLWIKVKISKEILTLCVVYMPVDGLNRDVSDDMVNTLLGETAHLEAEGHNVLIVTDFNGRLSAFREQGKTSYNGDLLAMFVECSSLSIVNCTHKCEGLITWRRGLYKSTIDYVLANKPVLNCITKMVIDEQCCYSLGSDHYMIMVHMVIKDSQPPSVPLNSINHTERWNIKDQQNWQAFQADISERLGGWSADMFNTADEAWHDWKSKVTAAGASAIGYKRSGEQSKHTIGKEIENLIHSRKTANRFHRFWQKSPYHDTDVIQELWEEYLARKKIVKDAIIKKEIAHKTQVIMRNAACKTTSSRSFWRTLKSMNAKCGAPISIKDPEDPTRVITDIDEMKTVIGKYWKSLGASKGGSDAVSDTSTSTSAMHNILNQYQETDSANGLHSVIINEHTVGEALKGLKNGKSYALDRVPNEFLKSGGKDMTKSIVSLFEMCVTLEQFPSEWHHGIIRPIHKSGDHGTLNNYRGITITSNAYKLFASLIEKQVMHFAEENDVFGDFQGAFRKGRRLEDHIFTLKGLCALRKARKLPTYLSFLDISKAFDTLDRDRLFCLLWEKGIQGKTWRLIRALYSNVQSKVIFGTVETEWFDVENGVKQGCVLSPTLFSLLMCDLVDMLIQENVGLEYNSRLLPALLFADDIVLMAPDEEQLNKMLSVASRFALKWGLTFNETKSKVMVIGKRINKNKKWMIGDRSLSEVNVYKYLGVFISRNLKDSYHIKTCLKDKGRSLKGFINAILCKHMSVNRVEFGDVLWRTVAQPALAHGCGTWFEGTVKSLSSTIQSVQYQIGLTVFKLGEKSTPATEAVLGDLGWLPLSHFLDCQRIKYITYLLGLPGHRLPRLVLQDMLGAHDQGVSLVWPAVQSIHKILNDRGLDGALSGDIAIGDLPRVFRKLSSQTYASNFERSIHQRASLHHYRHFKLHSFQERYVADMSNFYGVKLKFKARAGILELESLMQVWGKSDGVCKLCNTERETLSHFMFSCCALNDIRMQIFKALEARLMPMCEPVWPSFCASSNVHKLNMLIGEHGYLISDEIGKCFDDLGKMFLISGWAERLRLLAATATNA